jgi:hypothetical protein
MPCFKWNEVRKGGAVRLYLNHINAYSGYIENAQDHIRDVFVNDSGKCRHCKETCKSRKTYQINGCEYQKCDGEVFEFYNLDMDSIPFYIELIGLSAKAKKDG